MKASIARHLPASIAAALLGSTFPATSSGQMLATFDFEDDAGAFESVPQLLHPELTAASFGAALGALTDFAGDPGRAIAASGFASGNRIELDLAAAAGHRITVERMRFDLRVSASGPTQWRLETAGAAPVSGATSTDFTAAVADLPGALPAATVRLALGGLGASSDAGTLRLDNVVVEGAVKTVALPPALALAALPAAGCLLPGRRRRLKSGRATLSRHRAGGSRSRA